MSARVARLGAVLKGAIVFAALGVTACTVEERPVRGGSEASVTARASSTQRGLRRQIIQPEGVARLPVFSSAVRSGDFIFLSGALGALPGVTPPQLVQGGIEAETRQTMENIIAVLDAAGATLEDLVKCTVFLESMDDYAAMNLVYVEYFPNDPPARSAVAGSGLALGAKVEIECIAAAPDGT